MAKRKGKKSDKFDSKKEIERKGKLWKEFLERLRLAESCFMWGIDKYGQIRGYREDCVGCFCPITAVLYFEKAKRVDTWHVHTLAIPKMRELRSIASEIVHAADNAAAGILGTEIRKAVGLGNR